MEYTRAQNLYMCLLVRAPRSLPPQKIRKPTAAARRTRPAACCNTAPYAHESTRMQSSRSGAPRPRAGGAESGGGRPPAGGGRPVPADTSLRVGGPRVGGGDPRTKLQKLGAVGRGRGAGAEGGRRRIYEAAGAAIRHGCPTVASPRLHRQANTARVGNRTSKRLACLPALLPACTPTLLNEGPHTLGRPAPALWCERHLHPTQQR